MKKALVMISVLGFGAVQAQADSATEVQITPELEAQAKLLADSGALENQEVDAQIDLIESLISPTEAKDDILGSLIDEMTETTQNQSVKQWSPSKKKVKKSNYSSSSKSVSKNSRPAVAARRAARSAHAKSKGWCAKYVRRALQAAGYNLKTQKSAYQYATNGALKQAGFTKISNSAKPQVGDIVVINRSRAHPHGHIAIYDGRNWISDFKQKNKSPYSRYYPYTTWRDSRYLNDASAKGLYMASR